MFALLIRGNMIIFQDDDIVVCEKPYGVSSQGSSGENMVDMLKTACRCEIYPVHRLDTQTTGLIVYAKNPQSAAKLSSQVDPDPDITTAQQALTLWRQGREVLAYLDAE